MGVGDVSRMQSLGVLFVIGGFRFIKYGSDKILKVLSCFLCDVVVPTAIKGVVAIL